ncbi:carboxylate/amino acid/amine transporter [Aminobacter sp. MSH1]|uniref:DMT family transporter n=1 Tax=Aminobacter sp. MSH1 TaxID=374606 RepID=UPI000D364E7A|nr:DMT family transporter [Aminobacter sp. MSH1]AWC24901.1 carboxylate/amino acid/amine transporter [Aminobacter sp. MSH1]CAI2935647.1 Carboxylate/amino acid/amine transporter [Aminobacter niigataensis]
MKHQVVHQALSPLTGIALKVISVAIFVGMSTSIKLAGQVPAGQIVFFRSFFAIFPILVFLAWQGELRTAVVTTRPFGHIMRGLAGVTAMGFSFFALTQLPLPEAITLNYAQPLLVVVFSALILGENVRAYRWTAVAIGLVGVLIVSWPNLTLFTSPEGVSDKAAMGAVAAIVGAALSAIAMLLVRNLVHTERTATIVLWFSLTASIMALFSIPFGWQSLTWEQTALLVTSGFCGGIAQLFMTEAYRHAEASTVAPFEYTSLLLGIVVGYLVFGDLPTLYTLVGGVIVVGAGIFIIWRERRLGIERQAAKKAAPPQ